MGVPLLCAMVLTFDPGQRTTDSTVSSMQRSISKGGEEFRPKKTKSESCCQICLALFFVLPLICGAVAAFGAAVIFEVSAGLERTSASVRLQLTNSRPFINTPRLTDTTLHCTTGVCDDSPRTRPSIGHALRRIQAGRLEL